MSTPNRSQTSSDGQPVADKLTAAGNTAAAANESGQTNPDDLPQLLTLADDLKQAIASPSFISEQRPVPDDLVQRALSQAQEHLETSPQHYEQTVGVPLPSVPHAESNRQDLIGKSLGSYQIIRVLGEGGMGIVCEALDTKLQRAIALKLMHPRAANVPGNRARFLREAQAAAKLMHDHICPIYQVGEVDGLPFIAMPLLIGETLDQRMRSKPLSIAQALEVFRQVADGLVEAGRAGLVHRDIKPSNIWLEQRPKQEIRVRILDFGLARFEADETELTQSGTVLGTPSYMAPEQARGESVSQQADLFSLGAVMYELLTGKKAFSGKTTANVLTNILSHDPPEIRSINPKVPEPLSKIISRLLQKQPELRPRSAVELYQQIQALEPKLAVASTTFPENDLPALSTQSAMTMPNDSVGRARQTSVGRNRIPPRWLVGGLAGFAAFALVLTGILLFKTPQGTLLVEFDDRIDIRLKDGKLNVYDEQGTLRYSLSPTEGPQRIAAGRYQVEVTGADGLSLNTDSFEMKRGEQVVLKVSSVAPQPTDLIEATSAGSVASTTSAHSGDIVFPGQMLIGDEFDNLEKTQLRIGTLGQLNSNLENGSHAVTTMATMANDKLTLPIGSGMNAGAFATRCRSQNGSLYFNFCNRNDGRRARFMSLILRNGTYTVVLQRMDLENGNWELKPGTRLKFDDQVNPDLMDGKWIQVAARWNSETFDVWLNGRHVVGGVLPTEELVIGRAMPIQFCVNANSGGEVKLGLDYLKVWNQSDLSSENSAPSGLPTPRR